MQIRAGIFVADSQPVWKPIGVASDYSFCCNELHVIANVHSIDLVRFGLLESSARNILNQKL